MNRLTPEQAGNKSGLVGDVDFAGGRRGGLGDHAGARRRRADDDRVPAAQHAAGRALPGEHRGLVLRGRSGSRRSRRSGAASARHEPAARLRAGELLALAGVACVVASLLTALVRRRRSGTLDAWDTFGAGDRLLLLAALARRWRWSSRALTERSPALPVADRGVDACSLGRSPVDRRAVRLLERPDHATSLCVGAWLALAGAAAILLGAWQSSRDEHGPVYPPRRVAT